MKDLSDDYTEEAPYDLSSEYEESSAFGKGMDYIGGISKSLYDLLIATPLAGGMAAPQYPAIIANKFFGTGEDISELGTQAFEKAYSQVDSAAIDKALGRTPSQYEEAGTEPLPWVMDKAATAGRGLVGSIGPGGVITGQRMMREPERTPLLSTIGDFVGQGILLGGLGKIGKVREVLRPKREELNKQKLDPATPPETRLSIDEALKELDRVEKEAEVYFKAQEEAKIWGREATTLEESRVIREGEVLGYQVPEERPGPPKLSPEIMESEFRAKQPTLDLTTPFTTAEDIAALRATQQRQGELFNRQPVKYPEDWQPVGPGTVEPPMTPGPPRTAQPPGPTPPPTPQGPAPTPQEAVAPLQAEQQAQMLRSNRKDIEQLQTDMQGRQEPTVSSFPTEPLNVEKREPVTSSLVDPFGGKPARKPVSPPAPNQQIGGKAVKSITGDVLFDKRTAAEMVADFDPTQIKDIPLVPYAGKDILQGYSVANMSRNNPIVRWTVDQFKAIDRKHRMTADTLKFGSTWKPNRRGLIRHKTDYTGATTFLRRHHSTQEGRNVWNAILKFDAEKREPTPQELAAMSIRERQAIESIRGAFKQSMQEHNELAAKAGFSKIEEHPGFFPHMRLGDYMVFVQMDGKTVRAFGAKNAKEARTIKADLQKQFPDAVVRANQRKSKFDINDVSAYTEARNLLEKGSPEYKIIDDAFKQILAHRGFAKHTLHRKGVAGFLGENSPADMARAAEIYFERHQNFLANQEKNLAMKELYEALETKGIDLDTLPRTKDFIEQYREHSTGAMEDGLKFVTNLFEGLGRASGELGVGSSESARNALQGLSGTASVLWLTTPKFLFGNLFQPLFNLAKMKQLTYQLPTEASPVFEYFRAYKDMVVPSDYTKEAVGWARKQGLLESRIQELIGMDTNTALKSLRAIKGISRWTLAKFEQEVVRTPAFIMYDNLLKKAVPDKHTRWEYAGRLTSDYMVDYLKTERPMIYKKLGMLGDAAAPLKTYSHSYFGNALEYLQSIKHEKSAMPFAYFMGGQAIMSGVKGFILVQEANAIINAINYMYGTDIPLVEEYLITNDTEDAITFGGLSKLTGIDFSGSLSAPAGQHLLSVPGVEFGYNLVTSLGNLLIKGAKGTQTDADYMLALQSISSPLWVAATEKMFTKLGQGPPNPRNKMIPDVSPRTTEDWRARTYGAFSLKEAKEKLTMRQYKLDERSVLNKREKLFDAIVYKIESGQDPADLIQKYVVDAGGDPKAMTQNLIQRMIDKNMSFAKREMMKYPKADRVMRMEKFNLMMQQMSAEELGQLMYQLKQQEAQQ